MLAASYCGFYLACSLLSSTASEKPMTGNARLSTILVLTLLSACTWEGGKVTSILGAPSSAAKGAVAPNGNYKGVGLVCLDDSDQLRSSYVFSGGSAREQVQLKDGLYQIENESNLCKITFKGAYQILSEAAGNTLFFQISIAVSNGQVCSLQFNFNRENPNYPEIPQSAFQQTQTSQANAAATKAVRMIYDPTSRVLYLSTSYSSAPKEQCYMGYLKE